MRVSYKDIDTRAKVTLDKTMATDENLGGIMRFGDDNLYPQTVEAIISSSPTASACSTILARFLTGGGFENEAINNAVVGVDERGKKITLLQLLRQASLSVAKFRGFYIHVNRNLENQVKNARLIPFKFCRLNKIDDLGFCSKVGVYNDWEKRKNTKFDKNKVQYFDLFTDNVEALEKQIQKSGGVDNYKGQIYLNYVDPEYIYPLSTIDPVYLDCDTEAQVQIFKNSEIRNGFQAKTIVRVADPGEGTEEEENIIRKVKAMKGADGERITLMFDDIDDTGEIKQSGGFKVDTLQSTIDDKLFENWESSLANNIRKAFNGLPAVLIDYEQGKLSGTSGEAIEQATNYYNAVTTDDRNSISQSFAEIFKLSPNPILHNNTNWNIKPLNLYGNVTNIQPATGDKANIGE